MENIIKGILEGACFAIHKTNFTENNSTIDINGNQAHIIKNNYSQYMNNINITTTLITTNKINCPLRFYIYIFDNILNLFGNEINNINKYIQSADIIISHKCSDNCVYGYNYDYKENILIKCINITLNICNTDYNDIIDIFTNLNTDIRSYDCHCSCYNYMFVNKAIENKEYLQNELLKYIGYHNIIYTNYESYTLVNRGKVFFILSV